MAGRRSNASLTTLRQLAAGVARRPGIAVSALRPVAGSLLDAGFEICGTLQPLPDASLKGASSEFVSVPAPSQLRAGNLDHLGLIYLVLVARVIRAQRILEIGTYNGLTALTLARNVPGAIVHTLDLEPSSPPALPVSRDDPGNIIDFERRAYQGTPEAARIVQHLGDSARFDFEALGETFDLVYVDGAHSYSYVENDTKAAFSVVSGQGAVVWDDYWRRVGDVPAFLHAQTDRTLYRIPKTRLVVWFGAPPGHVP
jgi:hypothetical protein